jgi:adsorption protein B
MLNEIFYYLLWTCTILLVISGIDDTVIDILYWFHRWKYKKTLPELKKINSVPENSIALIICAWKEYRVIERTITYALSKINYSNYNIFIGVYPNDTKTLEVVNKIAKKNNKVIVCVNSNEGPTTKADNLNNVYEILKETEYRNHKQFDMVLIHDSEDFIHSQSLKLFNYIISHQNIDAVQIPVVPIKDKKGKFIHRIYCDGFAEVHTKDMIVRQALNAFIPFAGTGMAFKRDLFEFLENNYGQVFNEHNLTEDYELGLKLHKMGYKTCFVNMLSNYKNEITRIATKEYFPNNFWAAVKQRSRWTAGICFQNWKIHKWEGSFKTKYFLLRDRKTIFSNLMVLLNTIVFSAFIIYIAQIILEQKLLEEIIKIDITLWYLLWACFGFLIMRLTHRFLFTYNWYGFKYAVFSLIRITVDNFINFFATLRAIKVFASMKQKIVWESTEHY